MLGSGSLNLQELRDAKVKLSRKETELKEFKEKLLYIEEKLLKRDFELSEIQKERDNLRLKNEIMNEHMSIHNLQLDSS
jgi:hypothetical protein